MNVQTPWKQKCVNGTFSCFVPNFFERIEHDCKNIIHVWAGCEGEGSYDWSIMEDSGYLKSSL